MEVTLEFGQPAEAIADALIVPVGAGGDAPAWSPLAKELDAALSGELLSLAADAPSAARPRRRWSFPLWGGFRAGASSSLDSDR